MRFSALYLLLVGSAGCVTAKPATTGPARPQIPTTTRSITEATRAERPVVKAPATQPGPTPAVGPSPQSTGPDPGESPTTGKPIDDLYEPDLCPREMALVHDRVCVDRWEAALVHTGIDGSETQWSPYKTPADAMAEGIELRAVSRPALFPQAHINGEQAAIACERAGKRLCSDASWTAACRGPNNTVYPYGSVRREHLCNDDGRARHPVVEAATRAGLPRARRWREGMNLSIINQLDDTLDKTGKHSECTNAYGVFDMVGNLHEWIDDSAGTFRGGFYMDTLQNGEGCAYTTTAHPTTYRDYSTGFRCCRDPKPIESTSSGDQSATS